jgi:mono/diheme cytochrome c family protein
MKFPAVFLLLGAIGLAQTLEHRHWTVPAATAARQNPFRDRPELVTGGKKVFLRVCARCHTPGPGQKGPDLSDQAVQQEADGAIFWKISTGNSRSGMPGYGSLPEGQRWQLVLYIRSLAEQSKR